MKLKYEGKVYEPASLVRDCDGMPIGAVIKIDGERKVLDDSQYEWVDEEN